MAFLDEAKQIIEKNIENEQFGVSELASKIGMSRSNLLRKIKSQTGLSASQYIRETRLEQAKELLHEEEYTISEISYKVGFGSTSYFIKCFREKYGYSPGEMQKRDEEIDSLDTASGTIFKYKIRTILLILFASLIAIVTWFYIKPGDKNSASTVVKSVAVLPFINDSNDSTNVYIINGIMESILVNLQQVSDLRVVSRTSVEKFRDSNKLIAEIAEELNVKYIVEGSGQKNGKDILLNIQLIDARSDEHLWANQYKREIEDVFSLQADVAKEIADGIKAVVTPDEIARIEKVHTQNSKAYDYFLKGTAFLNLETAEGLYLGLKEFDSAISEDKNFALPYAYSAIAYYYLDIFQTKKKYSDSILYHANKAMVIDEEITPSYIAKAMYYMNVDEYAKAVPLLEKALELNPNSWFVVSLLADYYANYAMDKKKYLEYALKGNQLNVAGHDSSAASFIYLHLSNAFIQWGFVDEALANINRSLSFNANNIYSLYVKAYVLYAKNGDLLLAQDRVQAALEKDTTRLDVVQELAKLSYYLGDYKKSEELYTHLLEKKKQYKLNIYPEANLNIAVVYRENGKKAASDSLAEAYRLFVEADNSQYANLNKAFLAAYNKDYKMAVSFLKQFSKEEDYFYWILLFLDKEPLFQPIIDEASFQRINKRIARKFWKKHEKLKQELLAKGLI
jgi:TolB-like protein/AraC-like DNA-binding protein/Tfp pilus assembly protein PilF